MSYKFNDSDKEVREFNNNYFGFGVHNVKLVGATTGETEAGKEFMELEICDKEDDTIADKASVWFVGGASNISFNTLRQIIVHNAKTDADKEKARQAVDKVADIDELAALINDKTVGGELWFTKYIQPGKTYTNAKGEVKPSVNRNIYGYEPKLREDLMPSDQKPLDVGKGDPNEKIDLNASKEDLNIPKEWS